MIKKYQWPKPPKFRDFHKAERHRQYLSEVRAINDAVRAGTMTAAEHEFKFEQISFKYPEFRNG